MVSNIVQQTCTQKPDPEPQGCLAAGERIACDLEEILTCMVPVRARMLQLQTSSLTEVCGYAFVCTILLHCLGEPFLLNPSHGEFLKCSHSYQYLALSACFK